MARFIDAVCDKCALHLDAINVKVASRGNQKPYILFVGEAPGKQEDKRGEAFVGPAGKKLSELMELAGVEEDWCRWTNVVRCIPKPPNKIGVRPPSFDEIEACRDYLEAEIIATDPVYIVPLGATAIKFFLPKATSVKGVRGNRHIVEFPSVYWRYKRLRRWVTIKKIDDQLFPLVHSDKKMLAQIETAVSMGFPDSTVKQYTLWPTYHPAAILRGNIEIEQHLVEDLSYLKYMVTGNSSVPWANYKMLTTLDEIKAHYEHLKMLYRTGQIKYIVSDAETTTLTVYLCPFYELLGFCITHGEGESVFIPFNHPESPFWQDKLSLQAIVALTNDLFAEIPVVNHNLKYDIQAYWQAGINIVKVFDDTYLGSWTLFNDTVDHDLEALATRFTGMMNHKEEMDLAMKSLPQWIPLESRYYRKDGQIPRFCIEDDEGKLFRPAHMGDIDLDLVAKYCNADGDSTLRLQTVFEKMMRDTNLWAPHQALTVPAILPTAKMERDGILIDVPMFAEAQKEFETRLIEQYDWFDTVGYLEDAKQILLERKERQGKKTVKVDPAKIAGHEYPAKLSSADVKRTILYDCLGFPVMNTTKTGQPSADKEALNGYLHECVKHVGTERDKNGFYSHRVEALKRLLKFNADNKLYTSYIIPIPHHADDNSAGHCSFGIRTTDTGRFNCQKPSWHIIPWHSIVKKAIKPHHHQGLIEIVDYSQMELRILAMVTQDERLLRAFLEGKDLHRFVASIVLQKSEDEVTKAERRRMKAVNFGLVFGRGAPAIAIQENITVEAAQDTIDGFFRMFPKVKKWIDKQHSKVHRDMEIWTCSGFRRIFPEGVFNEGELERRAQNTPIQGPASDATANAMILVQNMLDRVSLQSKLWATIHDSLCFSVYPNELYPISVLARKCMVDIPARRLDWLTVALEAEYEIGVTWGELLEMELLKEPGQVKIDGKTEYFEKLATVLMSWSQTPELLSTRVHDEEDDNGERVQYTESIWQFSLAA
jgi:uracil-DNA glycosylase family 4